HKPSQAHGSNPDCLVHYRESCPGGVGGQSQKLEHPCKLARRIGKEFLEKQEQTLLSRHLRQQAAHLRCIGIQGAVLQQQRVWPARWQVPPLKACLLQSPCLLKITDILEVVVPPRRVHGAHRLDGVTQHDDDLGIGVVDHYLTDRDLRIQVPHRCFARQRVRRSGREERLVLREGSDAKVRGEVAAKVIWLLVCGHEHRGMRPEVVPQRGGTAFGGTGDEEIWRRSHALLQSFCGARLRQSTAPRLHYGSRSRGIDCRSRPRLRG